MIRSKGDVDKCVSEAYKKIKNDKERNLRGFNFAKMYFQVKEYETAKRYLGGFLSVRHEHAPAHKLFAQILEATGSVNQAIQSYKKSLELDTSQKDILLKICELYCQMGVDPDTARYWADRAEQYFPHNDIIFKLRECIFYAEGEPNQNELEDLINLELKCRPKEASLHIKLLKLYTDTERVEAAYQYATKMEEKQPFPNNIDWYFCIAEKCEAYQEERNELDLNFCLIYVYVLDHLVTLMLAEPHIIRRLQGGGNSKQGNSVADAAAVLHTLDQFLLKTKNLVFAKDNTWLYMLNHAQGQLYFHLASLLMKRAVKKQGNWTEAHRYGSALLLVAYTFKSGDLSSEQLNFKSEHKKMFESVHKQGLLRLSYSGHMITSLCKEDKARWLQRIKEETCIPIVREKIFQRAFSLTKNSSNQSFFLQDSAFLETSLEFPSSGSLQEHDRSSYKVYPDSLHHLVWLSLHWHLDNKIKMQPKFQVFENLQLSNKILNSGAPESLCQLDVEAFLQATIFMVVQSLELRKTKMQTVLPQTVFSIHPDFGDPLCSQEQAKWWMYTYALYNNSNKELVHQQFPVMRHGLEVIRCVGNHGMDVRLVLHIARHFGEQAKTIRSRLGEDDYCENANALEERAVHYWTVALELLDKLMKGQRPQTPRERLFESILPEPSTQEVIAQKEEGKFFIASHKMNSGRLEEALEDFNGLKSEYASYYRAQIIIQLAENQSEDKSHKEALLNKAKDALYLTMDRIAGNKKHPLNLRLAEEIEALELKLTDPSHLIDEDEDKEEENILSLANGSPRRKNFFPNGSIVGHHSTPLIRSDPLYNSSFSVKDSCHVQPSPERLDAQIRSMSYKQEQLIQTLMEKQNEILETVKVIVQDLQENKSAVKEIQKQLSEGGQVNKCATCSSQPHKEPLKQVLDETEDEDELEEENYDPLYDYSLEPENNYSYGTYPHHGVVPGPHRGSSNLASYGYQAPQPPQSMMLQYQHQYPPLLGPQSSIGMDQRPDRSCYSQYGGAGRGLPFSEGQQLPQFSFRMPPPSHTHYGTELMPTPSMEVPPPNFPLNSSYQGVPTPSQDPYKEFPDNRLGAVIPGILGPSVDVGNVPMSWNDKVNPNAPKHAFQIALPPSQDQNMSGSSTQSQATKPGPSSSTLIAPGFFKIVPNDLKKFPETSYEQVSGSDSEVEEEEVKVPFSPILAEVDVPTGEEDEKTLFEERGKLFRFVDKEWKERGIGVVKLLLNESSRKVRFLMRRDQVLKVCANHYLTPSMVLKPMKGNEKAWIWAAEDFAEEKVLPEQFCIRFKTLEIALAFKVAFEDAVRQEDERLKSEESNAEVPAVTKEKTSFGENFKPPVGYWPCNTCLVNNPPEKSSCVACNTLKSGTTKSTDDSSKSTTQKDTTVGFGDKFKTTPGSWTCDTCYVNNKAEITTCVSCETLRSGAQATKTDSKPSPFAAQSATSATPFSFGGVDLSKKTETSSNKPSSTFSFGKDAFQQKASLFGSPKSTEFVPVFGSSVLKPVPKFANCSTCSAPNSSDKPECEKCLASSSSDTPKTGGFKFGNMTAPTPNNLFGNFTTPETAKEKEAKEQTPFGGGKTNFGGFTFTSSPLIKTNDENEKAVEAAKKVAEANKKTASPFTGFQFGSTKTGPIVFPGTQPLVTETSKPTPSIETSTANIEGNTSNSEVPEEFEPSIVFKPVVPLPGLVDVKTGEEEETVLFSERAKLYRYDSTSKEWKERGIGDMKILENKKLGRFRILMRREHVLKVCANHTIVSNMKLSPLNSNDKTWTWFTYDFAEGEIKKEQFALKLKTRDSALLFEQVFKECCLKSKNPEEEFVDPTSVEPDPKPVVNEPLSLSQIFKPKEGSWTCPACYLVNGETELSCKACSGFKPGISKDGILNGIESLKENKTGFQGFFKPFASWECQSCYEMSRVTSERCEHCGGPKPVAKIVELTDDEIKEGSADMAIGTQDKLAEKSVFGQKGTSSPFNFSSKTGSLIFGGPSVASKDDGKGILITPKPFAAFGAGLQKKDSLGSIEFCFGSPQQFQFNFSGVKPKSPNKTPKSPTSPLDVSNGGGTEDEGDVSGDSDIFFHPVIPLPPKVDVKTGEENEVTLYCQRAKLFRYDTGEWKERGTGDFKILLSNEDKKIRLLMRREQVLKVCLNHYLTPELELVAKNEKTWNWTCSDFSEGEPKPELFAIRFKTKEIAEQFKEAIDDAKTKLDGSQVSTSNKILQQLKNTAICGPVLETPGQSPTKSISTHHTSFTTPNESPQSSVNTPSNFLTPDQSPQKPNGTEPNPIGFSFRLKDSQLNPTSFGLGARFGLNSNASNQGFSFQNTSTIAGSKFVVSSTAEVKVLDEKMASSEQRAKAEELKLPANFYLYEKKPPCPGCRGCDKCQQEEDEDLEIVFEKKPTPEQIKRAKELLFPENFYLYEDKPPCPGCRGCEEQEEIKKTEDKKIESEPKETHQPIGKSLFGSFTQLGGGAVNPGLSQSSPKPLFGAFSQVSSGNFSYLAKNESSANQVSSSKPIFGSLTSFSTSNMTATGGQLFGAANAQPSKTEETSPVFGSIKPDDSFSFAALANKATNKDPEEVKAEFSNFKTSKSPIFAGAGTPLFSTKTGHNLSTGEDEVAPSPDVHFEPVVPLPSLVDVKTGEEDEIPVFNERAKLYRYDSTAQQWKERGVGQFKVLKHQKKCQYRLLLRREQVFKIACNHLITPSIEMKPMINSDKSYCWRCMDFSEGTLLPEQFAIRFKTTDLLKQFLQLVEKCKKEIIENNESVAKQSASEEKTSNGSNHDETDRSPEEQEREEEEEEEDDDIIFSKRVTLFVCDNNTSEYQNLGQGTLEICYDDSVFGYRIVMTDDQGQVKCNHFIAIQTCLRTALQESECFWTAFDMCPDPGVRRHFKAKFSSTNAVKEFEKCFEEGKEVAIQTEIVEK